MLAARRHPELFNQVEIIRVEVDRFYRIVEGTGKAVPLSLRRVDLWTRPLPHPEHHSSL